MKLASRQPVARVCTSPMALSCTSFQGLCHLLFVTIMVLAVPLISGCSKRYDDIPAYVPALWGNNTNEGVGRFKTSYIVDQIDEHYRGTSPGPIGVTTFVNIDDLYSTSTFGRMYSEQLMSELAMRGFDVVELRHSDALQFLNPNGEFGLSRDVSAIRQERQLGGLVVGTYVVSPDRVYVNARLLDPTTSVVLSAGSVEMSKSKELARLIRGGSMPGTLERIPVRHLALGTYPLGVMPGSAGARWDAEESSAALAAPVVPRAVEPQIPTVQAAPITKRAH